MKRGIRLTAARADVRIQMCVHNVYKSRGFIKGHLGMESKSNFNENKGCIGAVKLKWSVRAFNIFSNIIAWGSDGKWGLTPLLVRRTLIQD